MYVARAAGALLVGTVLTCAVIVAPRASAAEPDLRLSWSEATQCYEFDTGQLFGCIEPHTWYHGIAGLVHREHQLDIVRPRKALLNAEYYLRTATARQMLPRQLSRDKKTVHEIRNGRVLVHFPQEPTCQFTMDLEYEPRQDHVDLRMTISPSRDIPRFEVFFASYVAESLGETWVPLQSEDGVQRWKKLDNRQVTNEVFQVVRDARARTLVGDGRWGPGSPNVIKLEARPFSKPILVARNPRTALAVVFLLDPRMTTLLAGQYHGWDTAHDWCFGSDLVAGQKMRAMARMIYRRFEDVPSMFAAIEAEWSTFVEVARAK